MAAPNVETTCAECGRVCKSEDGHRMHVRAHFLARLRAKQVPRNMSKKQEIIKRRLAKLGVQL